MTKLHVPLFTFYQKMRQRDEDIAREVELLKQKLEELERIAKGRGLSGMFNFKQTNTENEKPAKPAWSKHKSLQIITDWNTTSD